MESLLDYGLIGLFLGSFLAATVVPFSSDVLVIGMLALDYDPAITVAVASHSVWE
jgi:membrane protein YqaA with SNARE-associated domain